MSETNKNKIIIFVLFLITMLFFFINVFYTTENIKDSYSPEKLIKLQLSRNLMQSALNEIKKEKASKDIPIDLKNDPNQTGLIGCEYSMITTTLGHLEAKRTSVNPDTAALVCSIFLNEGLNPGDTIAIGSSASFPGLLLATLSACKILNLQPVTIVSFGASQYGANEPEFTIIDILKTLETNYGNVFKPIAISFGGNNDIAKDLSDEARTFISNAIRQSEYQLFYEEDYNENIQKRMELYNNNAKSEIKLFVNIGGSISNIGTSPEVLNLKPGLNKDIDNIPSENRGILFEFAAKETPILHLLYMKGLSIRYGLIWDPIPFQSDSYKNFFSFDESEKRRYMLFFFVFISFILCAIILGKLILKN
jgi:poly-gamma-glutamate system protein